MFIGNKGIKSEVKTSKEIANEPFEVKVYREGSPRRLTNFKVNTILKYFHFFKKDEKN